MHARYAWTHVNHSVVSSKERECETQGDRSGRPIVVRRESGVAGFTTKRIKVCQGNANCPLSNRKDKQGRAVNVHRCAPVDLLHTERGGAGSTSLRMRMYACSILCVGTSLVQVLGILHLELAGISLDNNHFL